MHHDIGARYSVVSGVKWGTLPRPPFSGLKLGRMLEHLAAISTREAHACLKRAFARIIAVCC
jgi:hypothetical protein